MTTKIHKDLAILGCNTSNDYCENFPRYVAVHLTPEFISRINELTEVCKTHRLNAITISPNVEFVFCATSDFKTWESVKETEDTGFDVDGIKIYTNGSVTLYGTESDNDHEAWSDAFTVK